MTPTEKALLLQAVAEMAKVNNESERYTYNTVRDNCREAANLILESIKNDFKDEKP